MESTTVKSLNKFDEGFQAITDYFSNDDVSTMFLKSKGWEIELRSFYHGHVAFFAMCFMLFGIFFFWVVAYVAKKGWTVEPSPEIVILE